MAMKLYYMPISGPCRAVLLLVKYLDIQMQLIKVDLLKREQMTVEFRKMNPQHCLPTLDDNGFILWECRAIMQYLVDKYRPNHEVYPEDPHIRATVDRLLYFDIGTIVAAQVEVTASQFIFGLKPEESKITNLTEKLSILDEILEENDYVTGSTLTLPDISICAYITTLTIVNYDIYKFENIKKWIQRLKSKLRSFTDINENGVRVYKAMIEAGHFRRTYKPLQDYCKRDK